jgi:pimeloyl-ACP methyl ester carboxylesterase
MPLDRSRRASIPTVPRLDTFVDVPGGRLKVVAEGDGPPIVLLHSAVVDMRSWDAVVPLLVGTGYRVVTYDTRGYGESTTDDVAFSNRADLRAVMDATGVRQAVVVGNSRGAMIALDTILESPERFVAFAWVGGGIGGYEGGEPSPAELAIFEEADGFESAGDTEALLDLELRVWLDGVGQPPTRVPAALREAFLRMDRPLLDPGHMFGRPIPLEPSASGRLGDIRIPTLVVVGALDTIGTRASAAHLAETVEGARLVTFPDVAHMVGMEAPERLAELIVELLAPLPRWS